MTKIKKRKLDKLHEKKFSFLFFLNLERMHSYD